ncbi:MAG TPA: HD domain-containing phosphohydrolase [Longimicrobiaceae bacterium]|nr:HD domain-containing phosphohydrolase [Longimicrobiaceae bacterium]
MTHAPPAEACESPTQQLVSQARAAEREGRWHHARALYEAGLRRLRREDGPLAPSLLRWAARMHQQEGDNEAALDALEAALASAEAWGDRSGVAHAINVQAITHWSRGELDRAEALYARTLREAQTAGDADLVAMVHHNRGIVANIRGDLRGALKRYRAGLAGYRARGLLDHERTLLNNLGKLYSDLRRWRAAERTYGEALASSRASGDMATEAMVQVNRAQMWIARGRYAEARRACDAARELAAAIGDLRTLAETHLHHGVVLRETGDLAGAARSLAEAARLAQEREDVLLLAEAAREQARLHWKRHEYRETLQSLNHAHRLFSGLQARRDLAEVASGLANLEALFLKLVAQWGESIESADRYTRGHCERVANYACALASAAGVDEGVLLWFRMGALLHDVGKIVVPPEILNKPGLLTPDERRVIERHPDAGVQLLGDIEFPWDIRPMIRHHHESWDGSGYPQGLAGEAIPLPARILCVADVYDALATDRPYRPAFSHERTLEIMHDGAGHSLDPELFRLFAGLSAGGPPAGGRAALHGIAA